MFCCNVPSEASGSWTDLLMVSGVACGSANILRRTQPGQLPTPLFSDVQRSATLELDFHDTI